MPLNPQRLNARYPNPFLFNVSAETGGSAAYDLSKLAINNELAGNKANKNGIKYNSLGQLEFSDPSQKQKYYFSAIDVHGAYQCWWCSSVQDFPVRLPETTKDTREQRIVVCTPVEFEAKIDRNGVLTFKFNQPVSVPDWEAMGTSIYQLDVSKYLFEVAMEVNSEEKSSKLSYYLMLKSWSESEV